MAYAEKTVVPVERSRAEIERILTNYGATSFVSGWDQRGAQIGFQAAGRMVRFNLPLPDRKDKKITHVNKRGWLEERTDAQKEIQYQQELRRRWRALALVIKAKLEAVETGITTFESEFLAHIILPDGTTVGQWAGPQLEQVYATGVMPKSILALPAPEGS